MTTKEETEIAANLLLLQTLCDKHVFLYDLPIMTKIYDLIILGYEYDNRKVNVGSMDLFFTSFMNSDTKTKYT